MIDGGKRSKTLSQVKPVKNISKSPQSFLEMVPCKRNCFHINCKSMHISNRILTNERKVTPQREIIKISSVIQEFDSRKDLHFKKIEQRPRIFVKVSFKKLYDSTLSVLHPFYGHNSLS